MMKAKKNDIVWKGILEDIFDDFLRFVFEEEADLFDFTKDIVFLNNELAQIYPVDEDTTHPKHIDKLAKVFTKEGKEEWVLVHVEVQGYNDADFAERMFRYFYRIFDKFNKRVTCVVIYTGNESVPVVQHYDYAFLGTANHFRFNVYSIASQHFDELAKSGNPFALVVQTALVALQKGRLDENGLLRLYKDIARSLFQKNIGAVKTRAIMNFLKYYVSFEKREIVIKFDEEIKAISNNNFTMGIEELLLDMAEKRGVEKGLKKGNSRFVAYLLRNSDLSVEKIASAAGVSIAFVEKVKKEIGL